LILGVAVAMFPFVVGVIWRGCGERLREILAPQAPPLLAAPVMGAAILLSHPFLEAHLDGRLVLQSEFVLGALVSVILAAQAAPKIVLSIARQVYDLLTGPLAPARTGLAAAPPSDSVVRLEL
jgi:hypothetical protein